MDKLGECKGICQYRLKPGDKAITSRRLQNSYDLSTTSKSWLTYGEGRG